MSTEFTMKKFSIFVLMFSLLCAETTRVFPDEVSVVTGEDVMLRLEDPNEHQTICFITTPYGTTNYTLLKAGDEEFEINPRFQYWGGGLKSGDCGVRIKNITVDDEGYWRLTSLQHDGRKRVGAAKVTAIRVSGDSSSNQYEVKVGSDQTIHLGPMGSEYCQIVIPADMTKNNLITGSCNLPVHKSMKNDSGNWTAMVGVRGKVEEVPASVSLSVEEERLDIGWEIFNHSELESISMYCNLRHSEKNVNFCRFLRLSDQVGFHLSDGLGSGKYSYFGNGLRAGDCGMTIEKPSEADYTKWQCILGVGPHVFPMAAFIELRKQNETEAGYGVRTFSREKVLEVVGTQLIVMCRAEASLKYCWLRHPNGTSLFPLDINGTSEYQYAGRGLQMGDCGIVLMTAKLTDSGVWECHMGTEQELVTFTKVKITAKSLTADQDVIKTLGSGNLTMLCQSVPIGTNLVYCRFVRPDGYGFNVHENSSLLDHYSYYGRGLSKGECGLLLHTIVAEDLGQWTCAARLQGQATETSEIITVGLPDGSVASIGMGSAAALILALICVFGMVLAARQNRRQRRQTAREQEEAAPEEVEMMPV